MGTTLSAKAGPHSRTKDHGDEAGPHGRPQPAKAAEYLVDALADAGVPYIFGVIGGAIKPVFTATVGRRTQIVMAKHEAGAAFMADGYARVSGHLGACAATSGPGATNLITGVASAYADSIPIVVLTGQPATRSFGKGAMQESSTEGVDIVDVFKRMSRYSTLVFQAERLPDIWQKALRTALGGRPGPVHLSIPADVMEQRVSLRPGTGAGLQRAKTHDRGGIKQAALHLLRARRPAILAGHGAILSDAADEVRQIANLMNIPVATTPKGKGIFPEDHRLALGPFGYSGSPLSQWYLLESGVDVLLTVGTSLSEWGTMGWDRRLQPSEALLQVDIDPYEIGKNYHTTVPLLGDAKSVLTELSFELRRQQGQYRPGLNPNGHGALQWPSDHPRFHNAASMDSGAVPIKPQRLMRDLQDALPRDTLLFVDGGANRSWAIHYWQSLYPRTFFCATGMASMGYGVAAAVGGKFAAPDRVVVCITGDGGFLMNGMEVSTAVHYQKQVIWVVLNDAGYGMVYHGLRTLNLPDVGSRYPRVDCAKVANGLGAQGLHIREPGQINRRLIADIIESGRPTVLDVEIDPEEMAPFENRMETLRSFYDGR